MRHAGIRRDEEETAVSPVIATILMVAITVVLAGVLYVWANNLASEGAQIRYDNSNGKLHISTTYNSSDSDIRFYTRTGAIDSTSNLRMNIMGDGYVMTPSQPSFRATKSGGPFNTGGGTVVFDQNQHNIGSNYNTSNGRFTAPVDGTYIFTYYSIYQGNSGNELWDILKNGSTFSGSRLHF